MVRPWPRGVMCRFLWVSFGFPQGPNSLCQSAAVCRLCWVFPGVCKPGPVLREIGFEVASTFCDADLSCLDGNQPLVGIRERVICPTNAKPRHCVRSSWQSMLSKSIPPKYPTQRTFIKIKVKIEIGIKLPELRIKSSQYHNVDP